MRAHEMARGVEAPLRLEPLTVEELAAWDELIAPYPRRELFHTKAWLDYLVETRGVSIRQWKIRIAGTTVGYFCGGIFQKGPFRILGSPLKSWGTNSMGPIVDDTVEHAHLLESLDALAGQERLAMIELEHPGLAESTLEAAGFRAVHDWTYLVDLRGEDPARMWQALSSTCRNRIRKATRAGLVVEDVDDPAIVDEYYEQFSALMRRKGVTMPFPREYVRSLFSHLKKADRLFALHVKDASGRVLATGLFPHDDATMYFWSGASWADDHPLAPNDYLHWQAMCLAADRGLRVYNMSGYGRFKKKFGGRLTRVSRWHKCYWWSARWARRAYEVYVKRRWALEGRWRGLAWPPITLAPPSDHEPSKGPAGAGRGPEGPRSLSPVVARRPSFRLSDVWRAPLHDLPIRDEVIYQYLPLSGHMDVLEIGPGSGFTAFRLARRVRSVTLLDIARENIAQLQVTLADLRNVRMLCADVCAPGLEATLGRRFDTVIAIEVFELLPDPRTCLKNLARVLRPGGDAVIQFPNYPPPKNPGPTYFRKRAELDGLLAEAGFQRWDIYSIALRPYTGLLYRAFHEEPLRRYRRWRRATEKQNPLIYDESWAFQHARRGLERYRPLVHAGWALLFGALRLGGDCFERTRLDTDILNRNLLVIARR